MTKNKHIQNLTLAFSAVALLFSFCFILILTANATTPSLPGDCEYRSNKTTFDVNNVTLEFYYGICFHGTEEHEREVGLNVPSFDLYFSNQSGEQILIKHVEENFVSDKYRCGYTADSKTTYNHSESITIPKELFTEKSGYINFSGRGINLKEYGQPYQYLFSTRIYYKLRDGKVTLSPIHYQFWDDDEESNENNSKFNFGFFRGCSGV